MAAWDGLVCPTVAENEGPGPVRLADVIPVPSLMPEKLIVEGELFALVVSVRLPGFLVSSTMGVNTTPIVQVDPGGSVPAKLQVPAAPPVASEYGPVSAGAPRKSSGTPLGFSTVTYFAALG